MSHLSRQINAPQVCAAYSASVQQASSTRFPYRIVTLVRSADSAAIKDLLQLCLQDGLAQYHCYQCSVSRFLSRITIELLCSVSERATLVRLVNLLGLEKSVRNIHWESMTEKSLLASPGNALKDRHRPNSSPFHQLLATMNWLPFRRVYKGMLTWTVLPVVPVVRHL